MTLASRAKTREPVAVRVPWLIWRAITQCRSARSAALLVSGSSGWCNTWKIASQLLSSSTAKARVLACAWPWCPSQAARNWARRSAWSVWQVGGRAFPRGVHRRHQGVEDVQHLTAGPHVALVALHQALRLAQQVRPAPQPARE